MWYNIPPVKLIMRWRVPPRMAARIASQGKKYKNHPLNAPGYILLYKPLSSF